MKIALLQSELKREYKINTTVKEMMMGKLNPIFRRESLHLTDIVDLEDIQRIQDLFSEVTGTSSVIISPDGKFITRSSNYSPLCQLVQCTEKGRKNCVLKFCSDTFYKSFSSREQLETECLIAGLLDYSVEIIVDDLLLARWMVGQVRSDSLTEEQVLLYASEIEADREQILEAFQKVPVMTDLQFANVCKLLQAFASQLSEKAYYNYQLKKEIGEKENTIKLFRQAQQIARLGTYEFDLINNSWASSDILNDILGIHPAYPKSIKDWTVLIHPDCDRELRDFFYIITNDKQSRFDYEYRIIRKSDGIIRWIHVVGEIFYSLSGKPEKILGTIQDITERKESEDALRRSEEKYREFFSTVKDVFYQIDIEGIILEITPSVESLLGFSRNEILGTQVLSYYANPSDRESFLKTIFRKGEVFDYEITLVGSSGEIVQVATNARVVYDNNHTALYVEGAFRNITKRKQAEEALRKSEEKYRTIFETVRDVFYQISLDGILIDISPSIKRITGYERNSLIGKSVVDFYVNPSKRIEFVNKILLEKEVHGYEMEFKKKDGTFFLSINARVVSGDGGIPLYFEGSMRDVTVRRQMEDALRVSEEKLRSYFDHSPLGIFVTDENSMYLETNKAVTSIMGYTQDELSAIDPVSIISNESIHDLMVCQDTIKQKGSGSVDLIIIRKDKRKIYCRLDTVRLSNNRFLSFLSDITQQKKAEESIVSNQKFLLETQMIAQLGNYSINLKNNTWKSSEMLDNILGIGPQFEKDCHSWAKIIHPEWKENVRDYFLHEVIENKNRLDVKFKIVKLDNGEVRWLHALGKHKYDIDGNLVAIIGTIQDVTERKNTAEALRASEELYRSILETSPDAILVVETNGVIRMVSPAALAMCHSNNDSEIIGLNMFDFLMPEDRESARMELSLLLSGKSSPIVEYRVVRFDKSIIFVEICGGVIRNSENSPTAIVIAVRDISERKNVEIALKNSQEQLKVFARHLENVREEERRALAREIHDELGQILVAVKIDLGLARRQLDKLGNIESLAPVMKNYHNLAGVIDNMINTARRIMTNLRPEMLDMVGFTEAAKNYVQNFEKRYMIKCNFKNHISKLELNSQRSLTLFRILQESLSNVAKHAKATNVNIIVRQHEKKVVMEIVDNGIGFDQTKKLRADSYGLIGMKERFFLLEGDFFIVSQKGIGTSIKVQIPYK